MSFKFIVLFYIICLYLDEINKKIKRENASSIKWALNCPFLIIYDPITSDMSVIDRKSSIKPNIDIIHYYTKIGPSENRRGIKGLINSIY